MGGMTTAATLMQDAANGYNLVAAGLMQAWSSFMGAGAGVDVGFLKAKDDEFFFTTSENGGTISREWLTTEQAKTFIGDKDLVGSVKNGVAYVGGVPVNAADGAAIDGAFRGIYEIPGVHPQNHCSVDGAESVVNFFYRSFGTPSGYEYLSESSQTRWVKEMFSLIGLIAFFAMLFPMVSLLLTTPFFRSLAAGNAEADGSGVAVASGNMPYEPKPLKGVVKHLTYWLGAIGIAMFSGFVIKDICTEYGDKWFPNTQLYPQDTTNRVAMWAVVVALFSLAVILFFWAVSAIYNRVRYRENASQYDENPFAAGKIATGLPGLLKTFLLAAVTVFLMFPVAFVNWSVWTVDFRIWTFAVKVFDVGVMLPTIVRYAVFFGIFFIVSALFNETYRAKNLPEWASTLINVFFNILGVLLVISIQYGTFNATGVLWRKKWHSAISC